MKVKHLLMECSFLWPTIRPPLTWQHADDLIPSCSTALRSVGGYSAEYGQSLSSVLLLNTTEAKSTDELNIALLSVAADITGSKYWEKGSATVSMTYANLGPYM